MAIIFLCENYTLIEFIEIGFEEDSSKQKEPETYKQSAKRQLSTQNRELEQTDTGFGPQFDVEIETILFLAFTWSGMILGFINAFILCSAPQEAWAISHMAQLILLLPLMSKKMSEKALNFVIASSLSTFSIYSLPLSTLDSITFLGNLSSEQQNDYLRKLGMRSFSALGNNLILYTLLIATLIVHY